MYSIFSQTSLELNCFAVWTEYMPVIKWNTGSLTSLPAILISLTPIWHALWYHSWDYQDHVLSVAWSFPVLAKPAPFFENSNQHTHAFYPVCPLSYIGRGYPNPWKTRIKPSKPKQRVPPLQWHGYALIAEPLGPQTVSQCPPRDASSWCSSPVWFGNKWPRLVGK